jgi:hypothetical protein
VGSDRHLVSEITSLRSPRRSRRSRRILGRDAVRDGASVRTHLPRIAWTLGRHGCERPVCATVQREGHV